MLKNQEKFINNIINNNLYIFNEYLWFLLYEFFEGITLEDINKLKDILIKNTQNIQNTVDDKKLLITYFDKNDSNKLKELLKEKKKSDIYNDSLKISFDNINELKNKLKQYEEIKKQKSTLFANIDNKIDVIKDNIRDKKIEYNTLKQKIDNNKQLNLDIDKKISNINSIELVENMTIKFLNYRELIKKLEVNYYDIVDILNEKNRDKSFVNISKLHFMIMTVNIKKLDKGEIELLQKYFKNFVNKIYGDYMDLDKYDYAKYNYINYNMLKIIKMNICYILGFELITHILTFITKYFITNQHQTSQFVKNIEKLDKSKILNDIIKMFENVIVDKLQMREDSGERDYFETDYYIEILLNTIKGLIGYDQDAADKINEELKNIITFYNIITEHLAINTHTEMLLLLDSLKKKSILIEIYSILIKP